MSQEGKQMYICPKAEECKRRKSCEHAKKHEFIIGDDEFHFCCKAILNGKCPSCIPFKPKQEKCPECEGNKTICGITCRGERHPMTCPTCNGTGLKPEVDNEEVIDKSPNRFNCKNCEWESEVCCCFESECDGESCFVDKKLSGEEKRKMLDKLIGKPEVEEKCSECGSKLKEHAIDDDYNGIERFKYCPKGCSTPKPPQTNLEGKIKDVLNKYLFLKEVPEVLSQIMSLIGERK